MIQLQREKWASNATMKGIAAVRLNTGQKQLTLNWEMREHIMNYQLYNEGNGVEEDEKKEVYHSDQAAIGGNPSARNNLGCKEWKNGNSDRTVKHWIIAANLGHDGALKTIRG